MSLGQVIVLLLDLLLIRPKPLGKFVQGADLLVVLVLQSQLHPLQFPFGSSELILYCFDLRGELFDPGLELSL